MGMRMSGVPSCALIAPSSNSTIEWTIDCGCSTTSIRSAGVPKSQWASITSKPLFTSVEESIVIFAPIRHWGWRSACSTVTPASSSRLRSRNAPPLHVTISRRTGARSPARHWNMAECSESIGTIGARCFRASGITQAPPTTSDSLLASASFLPAPMAATVGASPAYPTSAFTTTSVSPAAANCATASSPAYTFVSVPASASRSGA